MYIIRAVFYYKATVNLVHVQFLIRRLPPLLQFRPPETPVRHRVRFLGSGRGAIPGSCARFQSGCCRTRCQPAFGSDLGFQRQQPGPQPRQQIGNRKRTLIDVDVPLVHIPLIDVVLVYCPPVDGPFVDGPLVDGPFIHRRLVHCLFTVNVAEIYTLTLEFGIIGNGSEEGGLKMHDRTILSYIIQNSRVIIRPCSHT